MSQSMVSTTSSTQGKNRWSPHCWLEQLWRTWGRGEVRMVAGGVPVPSVDGRDRNLRWILLTSLSYESTDGQHSLSNVSEYVGRSFCTGCMPRSCALHLEQILSVLWCWQVFLDNALDEKGLRHRTSNGVAHQSEGKAADEHKACWTLIDGKSTLEVQRLVHSRARILSQVPLTTRDLDDPPRS